MLYICKLDLNQAIRVSHKCYKTFYARNELECLSFSRLFSQVLWVCKDGAYPRLPTFQVLPSWVGSWLYQETLDYAGKACH